MVLLLQLSQHLPPYKRSPKRGGSLKTFALSTVVEQLNLQNWEVLALFVSLPPLKVGFQNTCPLKLIQHYG